MLQRLNNIILTAQSVATVNYFKELVNDGPIKFVACLLSGAMGETLFLYEYSQINKNYEKYVTKKIIVWMSVTKTKLKPKYNKRTGNGYDRPFRCW